MGYSDSINPRDFRENLKDLKTKMIMMAEGCVKDSDELEEYIQQLESILKV
jgi:hypothetical protein